MKKNNTISYIVACLLTLDLTFTVLLFWATIQKARVCVETKQDQLKEFSIRLYEKDSKN